MSIRTKLTILMLVIGLIPTLAVSITAYVSISNSLTRKTADQLVSTAIKQEQRINGLLQKKQEDATKLANRFDLQTTLERSLAGDATSKDSLDNILESTKIATPEIQNIHLADLRGMVIASTLAAVKGTGLSTEDIQIAEGVGSETATTIHEDQRDGINKLYITKKVSVNKQPSALLVVVFRMDDILATVQDYTGLGATGETVAVKRSADGNATSLFPLRFDTEAALNVRLNQLDLFSDFPGGYRTLTDYRAQEVLVAARSLAFTDWVIATKIDRSEALSQITQLRNTLITIGVIAPLAIVAIALYLSQFFTQPILQIARAASAIGLGDFSARANVKRNDEIGTLASSINAMGLSLKQFVANIESQRNRLEVILNSTAESILAINKHGEIIIANHAVAELTQRSIDEIVGKPITDVFQWTQDNRPFGIDYATHSARTFSDLQFTDWIGVNHYVKVTVARVSGEQEQKTAQTIVTIHDETKSRELEAMKVDFVSMAAHELRTPLAAIRGYLELLTLKQHALRKGAPASEAIEMSDKYLRQAMQSASELGTLINNLLDVTRIERGTISFTMSKVDLAADVKRAVEEARFSAKEKQVIIDYTGPDSSVYVIGDRIALHEVMNNLISNAIKYTDNGGQVHVTLRQDGRHVTVSVQDTGVGIPRAAQTHLFTKFYRVKGGLNSGNTGTGLGLFISKSIVERHEGTITLVSEEGTGSIFSFSLPVFDEARFLALQSNQRGDIIHNRRHLGWVTQNIDR